MRVLLPILLVCACSEYGLDQPQPPEQGAGTDDERLSDDDDSALDGTDDDTTGDTVNEGIPDDFGTVDCENGTAATWSPGEVVALSYDVGPSLGVLNSPLAGTFHIYDIVPAESGGGQRNESMYLRITHASESVGMPLTGNCLGDFIVVDPDNQASLPTDTTQYLGTFRLEAGDNDVEVWHACPRIRDGECAEQHIEDEPAGTCDSNNINSVHMTGQAICLVPA